jgi:N-acetylglutamate synthase-like GNAT family acetyltransferase
VNVRRIEDSDRPAVARLYDELLGGRLQARGGELHDVSLLPGFLAEEDGRLAGVVALRVEGDEMEVAALAAVEQWRGAGTVLLEAARAEAARTGCRRAWLITTNDNVDAIRFYQRRGWDWVALHRDVMDENRRLKPQLPERGAYGIPLRHELEFELRIER